MVYCVDQRPTSEAAVVTHRVDAGVLGHSSVRLRDMHFIRTVVVMGVVRVAVGESSSSGQCDVGISGGTRERVHV